MAKFIKVAAILMMYAKAQASMPQLAEDYVHIFDINGTVMLADEATGKTTEQAMYQVVAEQLVLTNGLTAEQQLKRDVKGKPERNKRYSSLLDMMEQWRREGIITAQTIEEAHERIELAKKSVGLAEESAGVFPSFLNYVKAARHLNPKSIFLLHSFGYETEHITDVLKTQFADLAVFEEMSWFNEEGHLVHRGIVHEDPGQLRLQLKPGLNAWQANHQGWRNGMGGKIVWEANSILFDDNADICARPIIHGAYVPEKADEMMGTQVHKVNTFQALTDPDYFLKLVNSSATN